jgi:outer membrane protein assembly factor BamA
LPFEKRYFGGGANGVRAWMVRSLGPGSYINDEVDYYNQSGDINILASMEYRFKLYNSFEGTLFADAGNTWTIRDYEGQPGAVFEVNNFYNQIAIGYGTGLRIDIKVFVFRVDVAWKALDPTQTNGNRWVVGDDWGPVTHIAIGYPF